MKKKLVPSLGPKFGYGVVSLLILLYAFVAFYNLGGTPLENWDEAYYGENIKQILLRNNWIMMYFNDYPFTDKPPLYMWLGAILAGIFGVSEWVIRLPSAIAGLLIVGFTTPYLYKKFGLIPALAGYSALAFNNLLIWRTRNGNLDTLSTLWFVLIFFLILWKNKWRYPLLGLCFALLYLSKLALVAVPLVIFLVHEGVYLRKEWRTNLPEYIKMAVIMGVIPAIWFFFAWQQLGADALRVYLFRSDGGSFEPKLRHLSWDYVLYAYYSLQRRLFPLLLWGLACVAWNWEKRWNLMVLLFSGVIFVQLLFFERKNNWYLVPLLPFWSIALAYGVQTGMKLVQRFKYHQIGIGLFVFVLLGISLRTYQTTIIPMYTSFGTTREAQTARKAQELSQKGEPIVRLDHQFPTAIFYSNRRVLSSPADYTGGGGFNGKDHFISRANVVKAIGDGRVNIVMGKQSDLEAFVVQFKLTRFKPLKTNDEEAVYIF